MTGARSAAARLAVAGISAVLALTAAVAGGEAWRRHVDAASNLVFPIDDPEIGFEYRPGGTENAWGFREREIPKEKPAGELRIAVLGDSVTEGTFVSAELAYPRRLEKLLAVRGVDARVLNFGVVGYDARQIAAQLRSRVLAFHPDLIVYGAFVNDHIPTEALSLGPDLGTVYVALPVADDVRLLPDAWDEWLRPRSALFRWIQSRHAGRVIAARKEMPQGDWAFFDAALATMAKEARDAGVPLLVLGIPPHVLADDDVTRCDAATTRWGMGFCSSNLDTLERIHSAVEGLGLPWVDGLAAYRAEGRRDYFDTVHADPMHPDAAGHAALARGLVAPVLEALGRGTGNPGG